MTVELGGNISLSGFQDRDFAEFIVVKKVVGQYARKFSDSIPSFSRLSLRLEDIHGGSSVRIIGSADVDGSTVHSSDEGHNLFISLDTCLKSLLFQAQKHHEQHRDEKKF